MSRAFSTSATKFVKRWLGYDRNELPPPWKIAAETWTMPGGTAEQRLGELQSVEIKSRPEVGPIHKSHSNPEDTADVISLVCVGANESKTCHVYIDGLGTFKKPDVPTTKKPVVPATKKNDVPATKEDDVPATKEDDVPT